MRKTGLAVLLVSVLIALATPARGEVIRLICTAGQVVSVDIDMDKSTVVVVDHYGSNLKTERLSATIDDRYVTWRETGGDFPLWRRIDRQTGTLDWHPYDDGKWQSENCKCERAGKPLF